MIYLTLILGFILRLISLNQSFWLDEATSGLVARNFNLGEIITKFSPGDFHPPFYYLFLKVWSSLFGTGEISLRLPSVIFGLITVYMIFLIGKKLYSNKVGLIAGLLLAVSGLHIYYSQEARMYSLTALLVVFAFYLFIKIINTNRLGDWVLFSLSLFLIASTDYVALLIIPVFWIWGAVYKKNSKWFLKLLLSHIILVVFAFFWSYVFLKQLGVGISLNLSSPSWSNLLGTFSFKNFALIPVKFILGRIGFENNTLYALIAGFAMLLFGFPLVYSLKNLKKSLIVWFWLVVPLLIGILISMRLSIFSYFRFLFCLPAFYLLIAFGLEKLKPRISNTLIIILVSMSLVFSGMYLFNSKFQREDWRGLTKLVDKNSKGKEAVTLFVADSNMEGYKYYDSSANISGPNGFSTMYSEIWLMRYLQSVFDPNDLLRAKIEASGYNKMKEYDFNGVMVWRYEKL